MRLRQPAVYFATRVSVRRSTAQPATLTFVTAGVGQEYPLRLGFNSVCAHYQAERPARANRGTHDRRVVMVVRDVADQRLIEPYCGQRQAPQDRQTGKRCTEIINRNADTEVAKGRQG